LPPRHHTQLTVDFARFEFIHKSGSPERGRTIFEGLLSTFPKKLDLWNQLIDLEIKQGDHDIIRGVFERMLKTKGLKPKGAKSWFKKWSEWEEKNGDKKSQEKVKVKAEEWVRAAALRKDEN
jgi:rRNA biogenesis protein RRP5